MSVFYISDLHFGHKNCLAFDNRPFTDAETMDKALIENWNNAVGYDDDVWILGDVSWYNVTKTIEILKQLNGNKHLCIGNHDKNFLKNKEFREQFVEITNYKELFIDKNTSVVLCHYPIACFNCHYYGWYHLYGHVHTGFEHNMTEHHKREMIELYDKPCNMYNVGCMIDYMNYTPRTLEEIIAANTKEGSDA